jgi:cell division protein FtsB
MFNKIKNNHYFKLIFNTKNLGLYALAIVALSVTWSSVKIIQKNFTLQKQITVLQQEVDVLDQQTKNQKLRNEYYKTDAYLEIAARKYFGRMNPGENLIVVPKEVASTYIHPEPVNTTKKDGSNNKPKAIQNMQDWVNFFTNNLENTQ